MPELPDLTVYLDFLQSNVVGQILERVRVASPFVLRTADPPLKSAENKRVLGLRRLGKRLIFELEDDALPPRPFFSPWRLIRFTRHFDHEIAIIHEQRQSSCRAPS